MVLTQQRPRMQTIPHVLKPQRGDCVIIASKYHPCAGKRGYYRTTFLDHLRQRVDERVFEFPEMGLN